MASYLNSLHNFSHMHVLCQNDRRYFDRECFTQGQLLQYPIGHCDDLRGIGRVPCRAQLRCIELRHQSQFAKERGGGHQKSDSSS